MNGAATGNRIAGLSAAQLAFLKFAHDRPKPFAWRWLQADGSISLGPATHAYLAARKRQVSGEARALVGVAELAGLGPYWTRELVELNEAGLAAISEDRGAA